MGDIRYERSLSLFQSASDRARALKAATDEDIVQALAAASARRGEADLVLVNVLATEAMNRMRRNRTIADSVGEGIIVLGMDGVVRFVNPAIRAMTGWSLDDLRDRDIHETLHRHEAGEHVDDAWSSCALLAVLDGGAPTADEGSLTRRDGSQVPVSLTCSPIEREGEREGVVVLVRDITRQKAAERRREARQRIATVFAAGERVEDAAPKLLEAVGVGFGWQTGALWIRDPESGTLRCAGFWKEPSLDIPRFEHETMSRSFAIGEGFPGLIWSRASPMWLTDFTTLDPVTFPRVAAAREDGLRGVFGFPCPVDRKPLAVMDFFSHDAKTPDEETILAMESVGSEIGSYIERKDAERRMRESEARKDGILRAAIDAFVTIDEEGVVVDYNPAAERIFGYTREEIVGRHLYETIVPDRFRPAHRRGMEHFRNTGEGPILGRILELPAKRKDGVEISMELYIVPVPLEGRMLFTSSMRDVTDRKRAEEAVQHSERRHRLLYESAPAMYFTLAPDGRILDVNASGAEELGYDKEELRGRSVYELYHEADVVAAHAALEVPKGQTRRAVLRKLRRDGSTMWVRETVQHTTDAAGDGVLFCVCLDVTDLVRAEQKLRSEQTRSTLATKATGLGLWEWDVATNAMTLSAESRAVFGLGPDEQPTYESQVERVHPADRERAAKVAQAALQPGGPPAYEQEFRVLRPDGSMRWVKSVAHVERVGGRAVRLIGTHLDITASKEGEARAHFLSDAARALGASRDVHSTLGTLTRLAIESVADWCAVHLARGEDDVEPVAVAHADPAKVQLAFDLHRRFPPDPAAPTGILHVLRTGEAELHAEIDDELLAASARSAEHLRELQALGMRSAILVPLVAYGRRLGVLSLVVAESGRTYGEADLALARDLAHHAAIAIDNARLREELGR